MSAPTDAAVRLAVYRHFVEHGSAPAASVVAAALGAAESDVEAALRRLAASRALVLRPGTADVWMAMPFSAVPTPFRVKTARGTRWANCAWDALGVPAMMDELARIESRCADCDESLTIEVDPRRTTDPMRVSDGRGEAVESAVVHFAVPTARWWEDIGFT